MSSSRLEPGHVVAGRYRVESQLGEGGMGVVYLVRHVQTDEQLALKLVHAHVLKDASAVERFRREARTPARIASEHVARVTDADTDPDLGDAPFYVMELLRGRDLEKIIHEDGPIAPPLAVEYLRQASRALDKAHAAGIVHRDLKPENLFLTHRDDGSPCIKLLDFGIARLADAEGQSQLKTQAGFVFGTPGFMSPEQMIGEVDKIGPAADIWALGLVAFRIMVARDFWKSTSPAALCAEILTAPIPPPSELGATLGPAFDAWFARCVTRTIEERFKTAGEAVTALAVALGVRLEGPRSATSLVAAQEFVGPPSFRGQVASSPSVPGVPAAAPAVQVAQVAHASTDTAPGAGAAPPPKRGALIAGLAIGGVVVVGAIVAIALAVRSRPKAEGLVSSVGSAASATIASASSSVAAAESAEHWPEAASASAVATANPEALTIPTSPTARGARGTKTSPSGSSKGSAASGDSPSGTSQTAGQAAGQAAGLSRDQRRRLEALQRLCDQGTFTPEECKSKRAAITRGGP